MPSLRRHLPPVVALAAINVWICAGLFTTEYLDQFSSVDGAFISIARYLSHHWGDHSWWPLWHCGMPYEDTYVPLLHLIVAAVATLARISAAHAYHIVVGVTYALGPVTLYVMAVYLGAARGSAFFSALIYSLFSPSTLLMPAVARDLGGLLFDRRLQVLTVYGEGPHISVMTLQPLVLIALAYALRKRSGRAFALPVLMLALVFLLNVPGTMATGVAIFCWLVVQSPGRRRAAWILTAAAAAMAYAVACYGIPPSSELTVIENLRRMHHAFSVTAKVAPFLLVALLASAAVAGYLLCRTRLPLLLRFAIVYLAVTAMLVLTATKDKFELLPQVGRLQLEMEMAICLLLGAGGWFLYSRLHWRLQVIAACFSRSGQDTRYRIIDRAPQSISGRRISLHARNMPARSGPTRISPGSAFTLRGPTPSGGIPLRTSHR